MHWKSNEPKAGDRRVVKYFALFPTELSDGWTVWLESYYSEEEYTYFPSEGHSYWLKSKTWLFEKPDNTKPSTGSYIKGKK